MRFRSALTLLPLVVVASAAACAKPAESEDDAVSADELTAMAAPGVDESALDRTMDPCNDFYQFACGGYIASLPTDTQREYRSFSQLQRSNDAILAQVFDAITASPQNDAERNAAALYKSCTSTDAAAKTAAFEKAFRTEIEAVTTPAELAQMVARLHRRSTDALFGFMATADSVARGRHGAAMVYPGGYDWRTDYSKDDQRAARVQTLGGILSAGDGSLAADEVTRIATASVNVEQALWKADNDSATASAGPSASHPVGQVGLEAVAPHFDWKSYFAELGGPNLGSFPVDNLDAFAATDQLLATASLDDLKTYLVAHWYEGAQQHAIEAAACQEDVEWTMSDAIEPRFLAAAGVDSKAQAKARALWRAIVDAFGEELKNESWLDTSTRVEALVKLSKIRGAIGSSRKLDGFSDIEIDPTDSYVKNSTLLAERSFRQQLALVGKALPLAHIDFAAPIVNASYDGSLNKINVPGGILGGYFFSKSSPNLANFAAIGSVLGHELTHGFDNHGAQLDGDGVRRDWWSPAVEQAFKEKGQALVDEYGAFTLPGVKDPVTGEIPAHINGKRTLGENIADNGGVKTAYHASKVETMNGPVIAGFNPKQQFFVSYAQLWCGKTAPDVQTKYLKDSHSPEKARVNIPLQNFDAFASAFSCQAGSPMSPANRPGVW